MRQIRTLAVGLIILALVPLPCAGEWGWPPPGYSTSTLQSPDGSRYRCLCQLLRDRRNRCRPSCSTAIDAPCGRAGCGVPGPAAPAVPQGPPAAGAHP